MPRLLPLNEDNLAKLTEMNANNEVEAKKRKGEPPANPKASKKRKQKEYTSVPKTVKGVQNMIESWGYEDPDGASRCALAGVARGTLKVLNDLSPKKIFFRLRFRP
jgi:hypothetical protein